MVNSLSAVCGRTKKKKLRIRTTSYYPHFIITKEKHVAGSYLRMYPLDAFRQSCRQPSPMLIGHPLSKVCNSTKMPNMIANELSQTSICRTCGVHPQLPQRSEKWLLPFAHSKLRWALSIKPLRQLPVGRK